MEALSQARKNRLIKMGYKNIYLTNRLNRIRINSMHNNLSNSGSGVSDIKMW